MFSKPKLLFAAIVVGLGSFGVSHLLSQSLESRATGFRAPESVSQDPASLAPEQPKPLLVPAGFDAAQTDFVVPVSDRFVVQFAEGGQFVRLLDEPNGIAKIEAIFNETISNSGATVHFVRRLSDFGTHVASFELRGRNLDQGELNALIAVLSSLDGVAEAVEDRIFTVNVTPNDAMFENQWSLKPPLWSTYGIDAVRAWERNLGANAPAIAIVDTGITEHGEFAGKLLPGYNFISDPERAGNGVGRSPDARDLGDFISEADRLNPKFAPCQVRHSSWHGTHVAGIAAATGDNGTGIAGVSWSAKILPVRVLGKCGGYESDVAAGMLWAAGLPVANTPLNANPAKVINLSLGGQGSCSFLMRTAIMAVRSKALIVAAAGNENVDVKYSTPANCPGVLAVGSTNKHGDRAYYSNFGAVHVSAPGGDTTSEGASGGILSTYNSGTTVPGGEAYAYMQGTSMAAPHVAGLAALVAGSNPSLSINDLRNTIVSTAAPFPAESMCAGAGNCGAGVINAGDAVTRAVTFKPNLRADRLAGDPYMVPLVPSDYTLTLTNSGNVAVNAEIPIRFYLSATATLDHENPPTLLKESTHRLSIGVDRSARLKTDLVITDAVPSGAYYLIADVNYEGLAVDELETADNVIASSQIQVVRPEFEIVSVQPTDQAPAPLKLTAAPIDPNLSRFVRTWTYTWQVPDEFVIRRTSGNVIYGTLIDAMSATIVLNVKSPNGLYSHNVSYTVSAREPDPFDISLRVRPSNGFMREPLDITVTPIIKGGHPSDRAAVHAFAVNDGEQTSDKYRSNFHGLPAGDHVLKYTMVSKLDRTVTHTETITVQPNQPPVCDVTAVKVESSFRFNARCSDPDGRIKGYAWYIDGELKQYASSNRLYVEDKGQNTVVKLEATDDSGATVAVEVHTDHIGG